MTPPTRSLEAIDAGRLPPRDRIEPALLAATRRAMLRHVQAGEPVATWRNGHVVMIPATEALSEIDQTSDKKAS